MSGPQPAPAADSAGEADGPGILGSLPRTRPSVRSPRRAESVREAPHAEAEPTAGTAEAGTDPAGRSREQELEDLAKAGLSLASGAATLGFRVAGRAAAALRDAVERR